MTARTSKQPAPLIDFGGLGLPPAPPPPKVMPAGPAGPAAGRPAAPEKPRVPAPAAPVGKRRRRRTATAAGGTGAYLPVSLVTRLRDYVRAHEGKTYTDVVLDAVEALHERLPQLLAPATAVRSGPLFAGRPARRVAHDEPHQQINLRMAAADLAVMDDLVESVGAANRSAMLAAVLGEYLPREPAQNDLD